MNKAKDKKTAIIIWISLIIMLISVSVICIISEKRQMDLKTLTEIENEKVNIEETLTPPPKITVNPLSAEYAKSINVTIEVNLDTEVNKEDATYIYNVNDLVTFRDSVNGGNDYAGKTVYLMSDIDMTAVCSDTIGSWLPIGNTDTYFAGTFDGNYHTISNLYINSNQYSASGLFFRNDGTIQNLLLSNVFIYDYKTINESSAIGGISGYNNGTIKNCGILSGSIEGYNITTITSGWRYIIIGGINGINYGSIYNCFNKATIKATTYGGGYDAEYIGGINGAVDNGISDKGYITNCYNKGDIIANREGSTSINYSMAGGINGSVGTYETKKVTISNCYNIGNISGFGDGQMSGSINGNGTSALTINNTYYTSNALPYNEQNHSYPSISDVRKISLDELKIRSFCTSS
ncbi:MAG: hypothetical protein HFJ47_03340 [Clostridia bacterium]|nr:hypothetical protein [Clostridia bacterium]